MRIGKCVFSLVVAFLMFVTAANAQVRIKAEHSGKCFNVAGGALTNGTNIVQWDCGGGLDSFIFKDIGIQPNSLNLATYHISPANAPNLCLTINPNGDAPNQIQLFQCLEGNPRQGFQMGIGTSSIVPQGTLWCLGVADGSKNSGAFIKQVNCAEDGTSFTRVTPAPPPAPPLSVTQGIQVVNKNSLKCLNVKGGGGTTAGSPIVQWNCNGGLDIFLTNRTQGVFFTLNPVTSPTDTNSLNFCLDVALGGNFDNASKNGLPVQLFQCNGGDNQWFYWENGDGRFNKIRSKLSGKCLDVTNSGKDAGAQIQQ